MRIKEDDMAAAQHAASIFEDLTRAFRRQGLTSTTRIRRHPPQRIHTGNVSGLMRIWWTLEVEIVSHAKIILIMGRSIEEPVLRMTYTSTTDRWTIEVNELPVGPSLHIPSGQNRRLDGKELLRHVQQICTFLEQLRPPTAHT